MCVGGLVRRAVDFGYYVHLVRQAHQYLSRSGEEGWLDRSRYQPGATPTVVPPTAMKKGILNVQRECYLPVHVRVGDARVIPTSCATRFLMPFSTRSSLRRSSCEKAGYISPSGKPADVSQVRCACETVATTGTVFVTGEIRTQAYVDVDHHCARRCSRHRLRPREVWLRLRHLRRNQRHPRARAPISRRASMKAGRPSTAKPPTRKTKTGAGDQGMVFGYACNETSTLMPMPIYLAHRLSERLTEVRKNGTLAVPCAPTARPRFRSAMSTASPKAVEKVVVSTQHAEGVEHDQLEAALIEHVIEPVLAAEGLKARKRHGYLCESHGSFRHRWPYGRRGPYGPQDHRRHLRRHGPPWRRRVLGQGLHEGRPLWQPTLRAGSRKTWWRLALPIAARCRSPTPSVWLAR